MTALASPACQACGRPVGRGLFRVGEGWTCELPSAGEALLWAALCDACASRESRRAAQEARAERRRRLLAQAGGAPRWRSWSLRTYPRDREGEVAWRAAVDWLYEYAVGRPRGLYLYGQVGAGKTGLAWGIVRCLCEHGVAALIVHWRDLLALRRRGISSNGNGPTEGERLLARARRASVLALDDLGAERPTGFALEELATLVEARYQAALPTIVTSNLSPEGLVRRMGDRLVGERVVSRLLEGAIRVRFAGPNRRLR